MSGDNTAEELGGSTPASDLLQDSERELDKAMEELCAEPAQSADDSAGQPLRRSSDNKLIMNIPVSIDVVLGTAEMRVSELMALNQGSTVVLDRRIGELVDVVVNGRRIARGEIIVIEQDSSRLGIKLSEVIEE